MSGYWLRRVGEGPHLCDLAAAIEDGCPAPGSVWKCAHCGAEWTVTAPLTLEKTRPATVKPPPHR